MESAWVGAAAEWRLDGDCALLASLQQLHQRVVCGCEDVTAALRRLSAAARAADLGLRVQDDRLSAISNRQFVERRVYDDHLEPTEGPAPDTNVPEQPEESLLSRLQAGVARVAACHQMITIADSDSDSDSGGGCSVVLRPLPVYKRALPLLLGDPGFARDPHAGLRPNNDDIGSDTETDTDSDIYQPDDFRRDADSSRSAVSDAVGDRYSDAADDKIPVEEPAQQAARLAAVLGGQQHIQVRSRTPSPPAAPRLPSHNAHNAGPIFPWEPPPLPTRPSDDDDDDIFQELRNEKTPPAPAVPTNSKKPVGGVSVFGKVAATVPPPAVESPVSKEKDIFDHLFAKTTTKTSKPKESKPPEKITDKEDIFSDNIFDDIDNVFASSAPKVTGTVKNTRFDDDDALFANVTVNNGEQADVKSDKKTSIFDSDDDLFNENVTVKSSVAKPVTNVKQTVSRSVNVKETAKPKVIEQTKCIFESDEDDIFSEISVKKFDAKIEESKPVTQADKRKNIDLLLDDDDDDLFNISSSKSINNQDTDKILNKNITTSTKTKGLPKSNDIFGDDDIDDLFSVNNQPTKVNVEQNTTEVRPDNNLQKDKIKSEEKIIQKTDTDSLFNDNDDLDELFKPKQRVNEKQDIIQQSDKDSNSNEIQSDDWEDDEDIFKQNNKNTERINKQTNKLDTDADNICKENTFEKLKNEEEEIHSKSEVKVSAKEVEGIKNDININNNSINEYSVSSIVTPTTKDNNSVDEPINTINNSPIEIPAVDTGPQEIKSIEQTEEIEVKPEIFPQPSLKKNIVTSEAVPNVMMPTDPFKTDDFSSIFHDAPPDFDEFDEGKPEGSKNVNALFDDDIDYDVADDDNYDIPSVSDVPIPAFIDEPPALDDDDDLFKVKTNSKPEIKKVFDDIFKDDPADIFRDVNEPETKQTVGSADVTDTPETNIVKDAFSKSKLNDMFQDDDSNDIFKNSTKEPETKQTVAKKDVFKTDTTPTASDVPDYIKKTSDVTNTERKIGKLKPNTLNIDVKKLVPGARGIKREVKTDIPTEDIVSPSGIEPVESAAVGLLDNTAAKARARIQVKRRPSTRRARHRALVDTDTNLTASDSNLTVTDTTDGSLAADTLSSPSPSENTASFNDVSETQSIDDIGNERDKDRKRTIEELLKDSSEDEKIEVEDDKKDTKSKVVYILNDEDIFSKDDGDDDLFKSKVTTDRLTNSEVKTNDNEVKKEKVQVKRERKSIFDDLSDDERDLFTNKRTIDKPNTIFGASDEDIFKSKRDTSIQSSKSAKETTPTEDSDEELFKSKRDSSIQPSKSARETTSAVDSDEELFKSKRDKSIGATAIAKGTSIAPKASIFKDDDDLLTTKNTNKDPLSALWDDDEED